MEEITPKMPLIYLPLFYAEDNSYVLYVAVIFLAWLINKIKLYLTYKLINSCVKLLIKLVWGGWNYGNCIRKGVTKDTNKSWRITNGYGQKLEITSAYLSSIENGKRGIPQDMSKKIIKLYNLDADESKNLFTAEDESRKKVEFDFTNSDPSKKTLYWHLREVLMNLVMNSYKKSETF